MLILDLATHFFEGGQYEPCLFSILYELLCRIFDKIRDSSQMLILGIRKKVSLLCSFSRSHIQYQSLKIDYLHLF